MGEFRNYRTKPCDTIVKVALAQLSVPLVLFAELNVEYVSSCSLEQHNVVPTRKCKGAPGQSDTNVSDL